MVDLDQGRDSIRAPELKLFSVESKKKGAHMALNPPFIVRVQKHPGRTFSDSMRDARSWLDNHQIEAVSFRPVTNAEGGVGFDIGFHTLGQANLFEREFR
jgi:hypothetical protein